MVGVVVVDLWWFYSWPKEELLRSCQELSVPFLASSKMSWEYYGTQP
jgi:hypothetical protein